MDALSSLATFPPIALTYVPLNHPASSILPSIITVSQSISALIDDLHGGLATLGLAEKTASALLSPPSTTSTTSTSSSNPANNPATARGTSVANYLLAALPAVHKTITQWRSKINALHSRLDAEFARLRVLRGEIKVVGHAARHTLGVCLQMGLDSSPLARDAKIVITLAEYVLPRMGELLPREEESVESSGGSGGSGESVASAEGRALPSSGGLSSSPSALVDALIVLAASVVEEDDDVISGDLVKVSTARSRAARAARAAQEAAKHHGQDGGERGVGGEGEGGVGSSPVHLYDSKRKRKAPVTQLQSELSEQRPRQRQKGLSDPNPSLEEEEEEKKRNEREASVSGRSASVSGRSASVSQNQTSGPGSGSGSEQHASLPMIDEGEARVSPRNRRGRHAKGGGKGKGVRGTGRGRRARAGPSGRGGGPAERSLLDSSPQSIPFSHIHHRGNRDDNHDDDDEDEVDYVEPSAPNPHGMAGVVFMGLSPMISASPAQSQEGLGKGGGGLHHNPVLGSTQTPSASLLAQIAAEPPTSILFPRARGVIAASQLVPEEHPLPPVASRPPRQSSSPTYVSLSQDVPRVLFLDGSSDEDP